MKYQKEQIFDFVSFYGQKSNMADMVKLGYGFMTQKWLNFAEWCIEKMWTSAGAIFRSSLCHGEDLILNFSSEKKVN